MNKTILTTAAIFGILTVLLGAFGAHFLKPNLTDSALSAFKTGVQYQMYHTLFMLFLGVASQFSIKQKKVIYYFLCIGIVLFSGSLYGLSTATLTHINFKAIGFVTPIGGLCFIIAWLVLLINILKMKPRTANTAK